MATNNTTELIYYAMKGLDIILQGRDIILKNPGF